MRRTGFVREYMPRIYRQDVPSQKLKTEERDEIALLTRRFLASGGQIEQVGVTEPEGWIARADYYRRKGAMASARRPR